MRQSLREFPALQAALSIGLNSALATPLRSGGQVIGALLLASTSTDAFSSQDRNLLERVATQVEGAIASALLQQQWQSEAEERLRRLEELDQLRLQFLQMVTHEFQTPLASLRVSRDLLAETPLENLGRDAYSRLVNNMGRGVDRLDRLVTDLLDLTIA